MREVGVVPVSPTCVSRTIELDLTTAIRGPGRHWLVPADSRGVPVHTAARVTFE